MEIIHSSWIDLFNNYKIDLDSIYKEHNDIYPKNKQDTFTPLKIYLKILNLF